MDLHIYVSLPRSGVRYLRGFAKANGFRSLAALLRRLIYDYAAAVDAGPRREAFGHRTRDRCCAICGTVPARGLVRDHDHKSGVFRGKLCGNCNLGLGNLMDSPRLLRRAADYVESRSNVLYEKSGRTIKRASAARSAAALASKERSAVTPTTSMMAPATAGVNRSTPLEGGSTP